MAGDSCWRSPPRSPDLSSTDVHVWRASLNQPDACMERLHRTLAADERERAQRYHFDKDRRFFIVARGVLRAIVGRYLNVEPAQLHFSYRAHGKPFIDSSSHDSAICFNQSTSDGLALYAIAQGREIGVDVERIRPLPDAQQIAARFFSSRENEALRTLPADQRRDGFYNCWTRKEAYIKARGDGLSHPLDQFDVSLAPGEPARLLRTMIDPQDATRWSLHALAPGPDYAAALAVEGGVDGLICWHWTESAH